MTYTTLDNWQAQLTAKGLSHNDTVRLLQDAQEQIDALKAQNAVDSEAAQSLTCVISDIAAAVGIRDSAPNLCRETVRAVKKLTEERDTLQAELTRVKAEREQAGKVHLALNKAVCDIAENRDALRAALVDLLALTDELLDVDGVIAQALPQQVHFPADLMTDEQCERQYNARRVLGEAES